MQHQQYVGIDLHRRRSVIVRMDKDGNKLSCVRLPNNPAELAALFQEAG
jgi:predicted NBD/HSP70 family sugar kinase